MSALVLRDIGELLTLLPGGPGDSPAEQALGRVHDAAVVVVDGVVVYAGPAAGAPGVGVLAGSAGPVLELSAGGRLVSPGLRDPHTHPIWAGERSLEFDLRNQGRSYAEIQRAGGGILATVAATAAAGEDELLSRAGGVLRRLLRHGVTACEGKTGYGLWPAAELRLLDLLVRAPGPVQVSPTFLCHVPPPGLSAGERARLVEDLAAALGPARQRGAQAVDVYCDQGAFDLAETERLLRAGQAAGLRLRCHAEQFSYTGAAALAASLGAASVEHLEELDDAGVEALALAGTVANLLPGAALTLRLRWPDGRRLIDRGVIVALGTDSNPGSSLTESQPLMMSLACTQMGLSCAEAWLGVTAHAHRAIAGKGAPALRLAAGAAADFVVWEADGYRQVCQHLGADLVREVYVGGRALR